jgi:LDH2 family malate/lactate/ureidoglycolate dehydrogenase
MEGSGFSPHLVIDTISRTRVDDGEHANTPIPGGVGEDGRGDVSTDPSVDDEGQGGDEGEEETGAE